MPDVTVYVDPYDVLDDLDDDVLERELAKRAKGRGDKPERVEKWTQTGLAEDMRAAFYARNASRFEALLMVLDYGDLPVRHKVPA